MRAAALLLLHPFLVLGHVGDAPPDPKHTPVPSRHYEVVSEDGTNSARRAGAALETLRAEFIETFAGNIRLAAPDAKLRVALIRGHEIPHPGLYDPVRGVAVVGIDRNQWPPGQLTSTLRHEAAHQLFDKMLRIPVVAREGSFWYREGLASYFEGSGRFRLNGTVRLMRLGALEAAFRDRVLPPVSELVRLAPGREAGSTVDYALAWSFVHFLLHGESGKHRDRFFGYLSNLQQWNVHGRGGEAFSASFPDPASLHRGWVQHVVLLQRGRQADFERALAPVGSRPHKGVAPAARDFIPKLEPDAPPAPPTAASMRARYAMLRQIFAGPEADWDPRFHAELFATPAGLRDLRAGFSKVDAFAQKQVLDAIERAQERAALPFLLEVSLRHPDPAVRQDAATLVREFHYGLAPKAYFDLMRGQNPAAMQRVAEALEVVGDPHAIKYLVAVLSQVGKRVGMAASAGDRAAQASANPSPIERFGNRTIIRPRTRRLQDQLPTTVVGRNEAEEAMAHAVMKALRSLSGEDAGDSPQAWMLWLQNRLR